MTVQWETLNVFVSSTFRDLELARDRLTHVFQEIEKNILDRQLTVRPYDLRWRDHHSQQYLVDWCIQMVKSCQYFIGILGNRYGWRPPKNACGEDNVDKISITEMEIDQALESIPKEQRFFCFTSFAQDEESQEDLDSLATLKKKLVDSGERIFDCTSIEDLLGHIKQEFQVIVDKKYPPGSKVNPLDYTHKEMLTEIIAEKMRGFVGRETYLNQIQEFLESDSSNNYLGIEAVAGTGKSSLLASLVQSLQVKETPMVVHFLSMGGNARELTDIISNLAEQLQNLGIITQELKPDYAELYHQFRNALLQCSQSVWIIIDGIDEISEEGRDLSWLPEDLPTHVRTVISSRPIDTWETLQSKIATLQKLELATLTEDEIKEIISKWCSTNKWELSYTDQEVLLQRAAGNPLFLKVALDEISTTGTAVGQLAITIEELFRQILKRLYDKHGETLINDYLGLIAAGRAGISEKEISEILQVGDDVLLPISKALNNFIVTRRGLFTFFHREFERTIKMLMGKSGMREHHKRFATYLSNKGYQYIHTLDELPYQLQWAENYSKLLAVLTDLEFIEQKCSADMVIDLSRDFDFAISGIAVGVPPNLRTEIAPGIGVNRDLLSLVKRILDLNIQFLQQYPETVLQILWNYGYWHDSSACQNHYQNLDREQCPWRGYGDKLSTLTQYWRSFKERKENTVWMNSLRPLVNRIDSPLLKMFRGHEEAIKSVAFYSKQSKVLSASDDGTIRIWDFHSGEQIKVLDDCEESVSKTILADNDTKIISACYDSTVKIWNAQSGTLLLNFTEHQNPVFQVAITSDGKTIASSCYKQIIIWESSTGKVLHTLTENVKNAFSLCFSPNNMILASGEDSYIRLWDTAKGTVTKEIRIHEDRVTDIQFHHTKNILLSGSYDKTAKLYDLEKDRVLCTLKHPKQVETALFHPEEDKILTGSLDDIIRIWNSHNSNIVKTLPGYHQEMRQARFHSDGNKIITAGGDGVVRVWDINSGAHYKLKGHEESVKAVAFDSSYNKLLSVGDDNTINIWNAYNGEVLHTLVGHESPLNSVVFSPDGSKVAAGSDDAVVRLWDANTGNYIHTLAGHEKHVRSVAFTPNGDHLISGSYDRTIRIWNTSSGKLERTLTGHDDIIEKICIAPNSKQIASGGLDKRVIIWDLSHGAILKSLTGHEGIITCLQFNAKGDLLATGSTDRTIKIWNVTQGELLQSFTGHQDTITGISFDDEKNVVVSSAADGHILLWERDKGNLIHSIHGWGDPQSISQSDDIAQIITQKESTVLQDKSTHAVLTRFPEIISHATVSANNIVIGSNNNYVYVLEISLPETLRKVKEQKRLSKESKQKAKREVKEDSLVVIKGKDIGRIFPLRKIPKAVIGRGNTCDIQILDKGLSRNHALVENRGDNFLVVDLGSTNGMQVNGKETISQILHDGDVLSMGSSELLFHVASKANVEVFNIEEIDLEATEKKETQKSIIIVMDGKDVGKQYDFSDKAIIGSGSDCDLIINDTKLAPQHFYVEKRKESFYVCGDVMVNGASVNCNARAIIHGDLISAGESMFLFDVEDLPRTENNTTVTCSDKDHIMVTYKETFEESIAKKLESIIKEEFQITSVNLSDTNKLLQTMYSIAESLVRASDINKCAQIFFEKLSELYHINDVVIFVQKNNKLWAKHSRSSKDFKASKNIIKKALDENAAIIAQDFGGSLGDMETSIIVQTISTIVCIPIFSENENTSIVYIHSRGHTTTFRQKDMPMLMMLCGLLGAAMEHAK